MLADIREINQNGDITKAQKNLLYYYIWQGEMDMVFKKKKVIDSIYGKTMEKFKIKK